MFKALIGMVVLVTISCAASMPVPVAWDISTIRDGTYQGTASSWPNKAVVDVTVRAGRIENIVLVQHWSSWIGKEAEPVIPLRIIEKQSISVDAVTGATNSSRVIMNAVGDALAGAVQGRKQ